MKKLYSIFFINYFLWNGITLDITISHWILYYKYWYISMYLSSHEFLLNIVTTYIKIKSKKIDDLEKIEEN